MGDWYSYELERTNLANIEYRAKTGEVLNEQTELERTAIAKLRARLAKLMAEDPEDCECAVCVRNWEEFG